MVDAPAPIHPTPFSAAPSLRRDQFVARVSEAYPGGCAYFSLRCLGRRRQNPPKDGYFRRVDKRSASTTQLKNCGCASLIHPTPFSAAPGLRRDQRLNGLPPPPPPGKPPPPPPPCDPCWPGTMIEFCCSRCMRLSSSTVSVRACCAPSAKPSAASARLEPSSSKFSGRLPAGVIAVASPM